MLSYTKLSGNARRFKTLMGMSLQEFDLLFAKVEKAHLRRRGRGYILTPMMYLVVKTRGSVQNYA